MKPISSSSIVFSKPVFLWKTLFSFSMLTCLARCPSTLLRCRTRFSICRGHTHCQSGKSYQAGGGRGHTSSWALSISSSVPPWASQCLDSPKRPRRRYACEHRTVRQWGAGGRYLPRSAVLRVGLYRPEVPTMSGACKVRGCESGEGARIEVTRRVPCSQAPR